MMTFAIYPRKSKKDDNSQSMEQQIFDCEKYIRQNYNDYKIVLYDKDYALTGHSTKKRRDFQRMMNDIKDHKIDAVIVMRYDRLARNTRDFCNLYYEMEQAGCNLISISQKIDTTTPYGKKFMYDMASMAELEWAITSERYKDTARYKISKGYAYTGKLPTGYKIENDGCCKRVVQDHPEMTRNILDYYKKSKSKRATVAYTREHWLSDFTTNKLNAMLNCDYFFGACRDNKNFCEPYYTEEEFIKLRNLCQIKSTPSGNIYLFTGMIRCPVCGGSMCGLYSNRKISKKNGRRKLYIYYRCSKGGKYKLHPMNSLNQDTVESCLIENLNRSLSKYIIHLKSKINIKKDSTKQQNALREEIRRINYMFEKGRISESVYETKYGNLSLQLDTLLKEATMDETNVINISRQIPENWYDIYMELNQKGKQQFWHNILSDITIDESFHVTGFHFL